MLGKHRVIVENAYIKFDFTISRNITIVRGDSATGKTTLVEMVRTYCEQEDTGIDVRCGKPLRTVYGKDWKHQIEETGNSIIFIDEQSRFVKSKEFANTIKGTDNYYVIVTREKLSELPYSVTEIYGIRTSGKYAGLSGEYTQNEFFRIYGNEPMKVFKPDMIITEDSGSGFDFWSSAAKACTCVSAEGKANIINTLKQKAVNKRCLAIVDGAAFGAEMEEIIQYIKFANPDVRLYAPESFEYILLSSGSFTSGEIAVMCESTYDYADSTKYMSWEQFYTELIIEVTQDTEMKYSKKKLNVYYLSEKNMSLVLKELPSTLEIL